jgi:hypothetical protein
MLIELLYSVTCASGQCRKMITYVYSAAGICFIRCASLRGIWAITFAALFVDVDTYRITFHHCLARQIEPTPKEQITAEDCHM